MNSPVVTATPTAVNHDPSRLTAAPLSSHNGSAAAGNKNGGGSSAYHMPTTIDQLHAKSFKAERREQAVQVSSNEDRNRRDLFSNSHMLDLQKKAQSPQNTAAPGLAPKYSPASPAVASGVGVVPVTNANRIDQIDARQELYGNQFSDLNAFGSGSAYHLHANGAKCTAPYPTSSQPTRGCGGANGASCPLGKSGAPGDEEGDGGDGARIYIQKRLPTLGSLPQFPQGAVSRLEKRADLHEADVAFREARLKTTSQTGKAIGAVPRGGGSFSAVELEKQRFAAEYQSGNEDAYAHVEALNRSVRGYDDTSKGTLAAVQAYNKREQSRNHGTF